MNNATTKMVYLHALTPVHSGTGQTVAVIDLPIAREKATGWPVLPASSLKGVVRSLLDPGKSDAMFGLLDKAGAACFGDQRMLLLPVRSFYGTFAYVTCPLAVQRLARDRRALGLPALPAPPDVTGAGAATTSASKLAKGGQVVLEDVDLKAEASEAASALATALADELFTEKDERQALLERFVVVSDQAFGFLSGTATEVSARIALNDDGTTTGNGGNLWYEEAVPAEAVFAGPLIIEHRPGIDPQKLVDGIDGKLLQIGGKASVGRGLCRVRVQ